MVRADAKSHAPLIRVYSCHMLAQMAPVRAKNPVSRMCMSMCVCTCQCHAPFVCVCACAMCRAICHAHNPSVCIESSQPHTHDMLHVITCFHAHSSPSCVNPLHARWLLMIPLQLSTTCMPRCKHRLDWKPSKHTTRHHSSHRYPSPTLSIMLNSPSPHRICRSIAGMIVPLIHPSRHSVRSGRDQHHSIHRQRHHQSHHRDRDRCHHQRHLQHSHQNR